MLLFLSHLYGVRLMFSYSFLLSFFVVIFYFFSSLLYFIFVFIYSFIYLFSNTIRPRKIDNVFIGIIILDKWLIRE